jgi:DNA (cytosine-5)-methyltransferase 1
MRPWLNDHEPYAAQWLRTLWPQAIVDDRDIRALEPDDVLGHRRCHFFAGIGGWEYALQLAGWPEDRPVWTASLPCQPFSAAGRADGVLDQRHLWPAFHRLVAECRPATIVGEQVSSRAGRQWLAGVRTDLEALGYAVGAADLCAAGVGAPHIRQRLFWVAESDERSGFRGVSQSDQRAVSPSDGENHGVADARNDGSQGLEPGRAAAGTTVGERIAGGMGDADSGGREECGLPEPRGLEGPSGHVVDGHGDLWGLDHWADAEWLVCLDGKTRRTQPGLRPLAHGVPARASRLRAYGNAIVPQVAAVFLRAVLTPTPPGEHP